MRHSDLRIDLRGQQFLLARDGYPIHLSRAPRRRRHELHQPTCSRRRNGLGVELTLLPCQRQDQSSLWCRALPRVSRQRRVLADGVNAEQPQSTQALGIERHAVDQMQADERPLFVRISATDWV